MQTVAGIPTSVVQAIIIGIGTISVGILTAALWIWRHVESLNDSDDENRIEDLQGEKRSELSNEIKSLYIDIEDYLDENPYEEDSPQEYEEHVVTVIDNHIDPGELNSLVELAENINEASDIYNSHKKEYESCYSCLFRASACSIGLNVVIVAAMLLQDNPLTGFYPILEALFITATILLAYEGKNHFSQARDYKEKFDEKWEDYRYKY